MDNHGKNVSFAVWSYADGMLSTGVGTITHIKPKQCSPYMMRGRQGGSRQVNFSPVFEK